MADAHDLPAELVSALQIHLAGYAPADFVEMGSAIAGTYPADLAEARLMKTHMGRHAEQMAAAICGSTELIRARRYP
jgi:hypothetical protein